MRSNLFIGLFVAGQLAMTFLTQALVVIVVGPGVATDSLIASQTLPTVALSVFSAALIGLWQNRLAVAPADQAVAATRSALGHGIMVAAATLVLTALISVIATPWLFPGFSPERLHLTSNLTLINTIGMSFSLASAINLAAGRAFSRLVVLEAGSFVVMLLAMVALYPVLAEWGVTGASWLMAGRSAAAFLVGWWVLGRPIPDFRMSADKRQVFSDLRPITSAAALTKLGPVVERFWGSQAGPGGLTLYVFAQSGVTASASVVERSLVSGSIGDIARAWNTRKLDVVRREVRRCIRICWLTVAFGGAALLGLAIIWPFASSAIPNLSRADGWLLIQIAALLLPQLATTATGTLFVSVCYAAGDVTTPPRIGIVVFVVGTIAKSIAFSFAGFHGMAAAGTAQLLLSSVLLYRAYRRCLKDAAHS